MINNKDNTYGVSPIIGVLLFVSITLIVVLVIANFTLDLGSSENSLEIQEQDNGIIIDMNNNNTITNIEVDTPSGFAHIVYENNGEIELLYGEGEYIVTIVTEEDDTELYDTYTIE